MNIQETLTQRIKEQFVSLLTDEELEILVNKEIKQIFMINKVTYKEEPNLFEDITEFSIDSEQEHRRGSNFYREDIIEFKPEHKEYFPDVENFEQYIGTWKTNNIIWDDNYGFDEEFSELTRVEKVETVTYTWKEV